MEKEYKEEYNSALKRYFKRYGEKDDKVGG